MREIYLKSIFILFLLAHCADGEINFQSINNTPIDFNVNSGEECPYDSRLSGNYNQSVELEGDCGFLEFNNNICSIADTTVFPLGNKRFNFISYNDEGNSTAFSLFLSREHTLQAGDDLTLNQFKNKSLGTKNQFFLTYFDYQDIETHNYTVTNASGGRIKIISLDFENNLLEIELSDIDFNFDQEVCNLSGGFNKFN